MLRAVQRPVERRPHWLVIAVVALSAVALSGCGKSKAQKAAEADQIEQARVAAAAAAASAEERRSDAAQAAAAKRAEQQLQEENATLVAQLRERTAQAMRDPGSAQFQNVRLNSRRSAICGQINAKNGFGGYVGYRDFITTDKGVFVKPEGCGTLPPVQMMERFGAQVASACIDYAMTTKQDNTFE